MKLSARVGAAVLVAAVASLAVSGCAHAPGTAGTGGETSSGAIGLVVPPVSRRDVLRLGLGRVTVGSVVLTPNPVGYEVYYGCLYGRHPAYVMRYSVVGPNLSVRGWVHCANKSFHKKITGPITSPIEVIVQIEARPEVPHGYLVLRSDGN